MRDANSSLLGLICASLIAASLLLSAMSDANSSLNGLVGTSLVAASLSLSSLGYSLDTRLEFFNTRLGILDDWLFLVCILFHPRRDD
jgi:hypothetical protein